MNPTIEAADTGRARRFPMRGDDVNHISLPDRPTWQDQAACNGTDDPVFFPEFSKMTFRTEEQAAAKADLRYCRACPVRIECLASAMDWKDIGVWAGTTTFLRQQLARERERTKCPRCRCLQLARVDRHALCGACGMSWRVPSKRS